MQMNNLSKLLFIKTFPNTNAMKLKIITICIIAISYFSKQKIDQNSPIKKNTIKIAKIDSLPTEFHYIIENHTILYGDSNINYTSTEIDTLDFLEPVQILKHHKELKHSIGGYRDLEGYVCYVKTLHNKKGYLFSEHLQSYKELSALLDTEELDFQSVLKKGRLSKAEGIDRLIESFDNQPTKELYYSIANRLSLRKGPSLQAKKIKILKYLEPMEVIENLVDKKETVLDNEDGIIKGNWCHIKLLNGTEGYVFNGYIKPFEELSDKLNQKGIEADELLINGKLKVTTSLDEFLEVMGKPDSIKSYTIVDDWNANLIHKHYEDGVLIIQEETDPHLELGDGGWVYQDLEMQFFYKNGIEYEELEGEVGFASIDFMQNNNFLVYNGIRIDSSTTLKTIAKLFPIQTINKRWRYDSENYAHFYEFGTLREKNDATEIYWQLYYDKKATSFNVYWYD